MILTTATWPTTTTKYYNNTNDTSNYDSSNHFKPYLCKILVPVAYSFYIFIVKKLEKMIAF